MFSTVTNVCTVFVGARCMSGSFFSAVANIDHENVIVNNAPNEWIRFSLRASFSMYIFLVFLYIWIFFCLFLPFSPFSIFSHDFSNFIFSSLFLLLFFLFFLFFSFFLFSLYFSLFVHFLHFFYHFLSLFRNFPCFSLLLLFWQHCWASRPIFLLSLPTRETVIFPISFKWHLWCFMNVVLFSVWCYNNMQHESALVCSQTFTLPTALEFLWDSSRTSLSCINRNKKCFV